MFSNKIDVDRHVKELFNKLNTDSEVRRREFAFGMSLLPLTLLRQVYALGGFRLHKNL